MTTLIRKRPVSGARLPVLFVESRTGGRSSHEPDKTRFYPRYDCCNSVILIGLAGNAPNFTVISAFPIWDGQPRR